MHALLKILAWIVWCSIFGALLGLCILHNYTAMGQQEFDIPLMTRTVVLRGITLGSGLGFILGLAACVPKRKRKPKGLITEPAIPNEAESAPAPGEMPEQGTAPDPR